MVLLSHDLTQGQRTAPALRPCTGPIDPVSQHTAALAAVVAWKMRQIEQVAFVKLDTGAFVIGDIRVFATDPAELYEGFHDMV